MNNDYHFRTRWRVQGTAEDVFDLVSDPARYPSWWPSVYLKVEELEPGNQNGLGRRFRFHTKGWLPYTLDWESCAIESIRPNRLSIRATGDFNGGGIWTIGQKGTCTDVEFDWKLTAEKPLLRYLSFPFKLFFSANHRWAMRRGLEGLEAELKHRHAASTGTLDSSDSDERCKLRREAYGLCKAQKLRPFFLVASQTIQRSDASLAIEDDPNDACFSILRIITVGILAAGVV